MRYLLYSIENIREKIYERKLNNDMGWRYRKSIKLPMGFRLNFSKHGIGYSYGFKGYRHTIKADGGTRDTFTIPKTDISYVKENKKNDKTINLDKEQNNKNLGATMNNNKYCGYNVYRAMDNVVIHSIIWAITLVLWFSLICAYSDYSTTIEENTVTESQTVLTVYFLTTVFLLLGLIIYGIYILVKFAMAIGNKPKTDNYIIQLWSGICMISTSYNDNIVINCNSRNKIYYIADKDLHSYIVSNEQTIKQQLNYRYYNLNELNKIQTELMVYTNNLFNNKTLISKETYRLIIDISKAIKYKQSVLSVMQINKISGSCGKSYEITVDKVNEYINNIEQKRQQEEVKKQAFNNWYKEYQKQQKMNEENKDKSGKENNLNSKLDAYLAIFNLTIPFTKDELKHKHRFLLKAFHPDNNIKDEEERNSYTARINEAYNYLKDYTS